MTRPITFLLLLMCFTLSGCERYVSWNQKLTLHFSVPGGTKTASSVVHVTWRHPEYVMRSFVPGGDNWHNDLKGEAVVAELGEGRYLFALIDGQSSILRGSLADADAVQYDRDGGYPRYALALSKAARDQTGPLDVPRARWPRLVTFSDIADPTSVALVDPDDLAASFGAGSALEAVTVEVTREPVTEGVVEGGIGVACPCELHHTA
ncbi:hypothetical protein [Celeribacter persicus]|uniref:Uncharacterized protein n=1 Tax=Celeribacter persicus TaxID=1651082 RepID=A0A2T5HUY0_9RHOB|nr:hypothetical protein [Celeribacter persicus]PTQ75288.1 hypothetical protein C8N42_102208 [Celeribacter persicus]